MPILKKVYPVYPEQQRRESNRRGFALPLIIIAILLPIVILLAAAPWVTEDFAKQKVLSSIKPPCEEFITPEVVVDFKTTFPADVQRFNLKELFGFGKQTKIVVNCPPLAQTPTIDTYFVSFIGTVHKLSHMNINSHKKQKIPTKLLTPIKSEQIGKHIQIPNLSILSVTLHR